LILQNLSHEAPNRLILSTAAQGWGEAGDKHFPMPLELYDMHRLKRIRGQIQSLISTLSEVSFIALFMRLLIVENTLPLGFFSSGGLVAVSLLDLVTLSLEAAG
jgi:hypothetical protein